ncbi:MAG: cyclic-di-AMP receptor [Symbiobacteriaceae bacterium]|nr:cyclic-di-AMP receptor [Symbiobacteriaceae bacterium]
MKLIIAVVQDQDVQKANGALISAGFRTTRFASSGGFLRSGSTTMLVGVEDDQVTTACDILKSVCQARTKMVTPMTPMAGSVDSFIPFPVEVVVGGVNLFVVNIERYERA